MGWDYSQQKLERAPACFQGCLGLCGLWRLHDICLLQLLQQIYKVNFLLHKDTMAFDDNGDPLGDYNIISWEWNGPEWSFRVIGSATRSPVQLDINKTKIQWSGKTNQVTGTWLLPKTAVCSQESGE